MKFTYSWRKMAKLFVNSGDPDQMPKNTASDLGLNCLPSTLLWVSQLQWVNKRTPRQFNSENRRNTIGSPRKIKPNTLREDLANATDITANAFTIANNARQIAQDTQQTMLSKIADVIQTVESVTGTVRNVSDTVRDITETVKTVSDTIDTISNTVQNVKDNIHQQTEGITPTVQNKENDIQPILDRLTKLENQTPTETPTETTTGTPTETRPPNYTLRFFRDTYQIWTLVYFQDYTWQTKPKAQTTTTQ